MTILKRIERAPRVFGAALARPAHTPPPHKEEAGRGVGRTRARRTLDTPSRAAAGWEHRLPPMAFPGASSPHRVVIPAKAGIHHRERAPPRRTRRGVRKNTRAPDTGHAFARGRRRGASPPADDLPRLVIPPSSRHSLIGSSFPRKRESIMANTRPRTAPPGREGGRQKHARAGHWTRLRARPPDGGIASRRWPSPARHSPIESSFPRKRESIIANANPRAAPPGRDHPPPRLPPVRGEEYEVGPPP